MANNSGEGSVPIEDRVQADTGKGYQLIGTVIRSMNAAILDGYDPNNNMPDTPQVLTRFTVKVEKILEFTSGIHSDIPIEA